MNLNNAKKLFPIFGFPIYVHFTFLILAALFIFPGFGNDITQHLAKLTWLPVLFVSIVVHELGHAVAIRKLGYGQSKLLLWGMGGLCINRRRYKPVDGLKISLAGPAFGIVLGLPFIPLMFLDLGLIARSAVWGMIFVNIGWSIANLLPIFPLDGGRALFYGLRHFRKYTADKAARRAGLVGLVLLVPILVYALLTQQLFLLLIVFFIGQTAYQAWKHGHGALQL